MIKKNLIKTSLITMAVLTLAFGMTACGSKKNTAVDTDNTPATTKAVVQEQTTKSQTEATTTTEPTSEESATEAVEIAVNDTQEDTNTEAPVEAPVEEPVYVDTPAQPTPELTHTPEPQPEAPTPAEPEPAPAPVVYTKDNPLVIKVANSVEVKTENGECLGVGHSPVLHYMGNPHWVGDDGYVHTICPLCGNEVVQKLNGVGDYDNYNFDGTYHDC